MVEQDLTYSIIFDIPKDPISVDEFAKGMQETLSSLEEINNAIACGINTSIKVVSYIESIEAGSIEFKLRDDAKLGKDKEAIEILSASLITVATGDLSSFIPSLLNRCRGAIIQIQNRAVENKEKKRLIEEAITKELEDSGINNKLIGYYLDKNRLNKAIKHFSEGVKKTGDNVFYKSSTKEDKIKINSSLADLIEDQNRERPEASQDPIRTNLTIRVVELDLYQARNSNLPKAGSMGLIKDISDKPKVLSYANDRLRYDLTKAEDNPFNFTYMVDVQVKLKDGKNNYEDHRNIQEYEILKLHGVVSVEDMFEEV